MNVGAMQREVILYHTMLLQILNIKFASQRFPNDELMLSAIEGIEKFLGIFFEWQCTVAIFDTHLEP